MSIKRKSLKKSVIIDFIVAVAITLIASIIGFYLFVNNQTLNELVQINVDNQEDTQEIISIINQNIAT